MQILENNGMTVRFQETVRGMMTVLAEKIEHLQ